MSFRLSDQRPNQTRIVENPLEEKKKFFFVVEGEKTECMYIRAIANHVDRNTLVDVCLLERMKSSESNQFNITSAISSYFSKTENLTDDQKNQFLDLIYRFEEEQIEEEVILEAAESILGDEVGFFIEVYNERVIEQLKALHGLLGYEKGHDKICLILDRDQGSFTPSQYDKVLAICNEFDFLLGISNPNFEFYLFLHINDGSSYDKSLIYKNPRMSRSKSSKKFTEKILKDELKEFEQTYSKKKYDPDFYISRLDEVQQNIVNYTDDNEKLKNELGSSVQKIIRQIVKSI